MRGEIDVPDGYTVLEGTPLGDRRSVGVVVSRFNGGVTNQLLAAALEALDGGRCRRRTAITVVPVPGAFELPLAAMALAKTRRYACIVALGAIVRGETPHFDYVAAECASGLQLAGIETGVPVAFGVLTVDNVEQAEARIDKAADAVRSALEMADLFARLRAAAREFAATLPPAMSKICAICGKKPGFGNHRSHSMVATKRRFDPNLQRVRMILNGSPKRAYVCTRCLKAGKVTKADLSNSAAAAARV